jgi:MGT family glycosyltransferase
VLDQETPAWEPPGELLVLISFSTTYMRHEDAMRRVFEALRGDGASAICTLGHGLSREAVNPPANVVTYDWLAHSAVLPHTAAVVTHAGHSTVMAAFAHGVPLVCIPMGRDQDANAERVEAVGAGRRLPVDATPAAIRDALRDVLTNPSYREVARRFSDQIADLGRGERAVTELETLLS